MKPLPLKPVSEAPVQTYFSDSVQVADVMSWALEQTGPAEAVISTFSTSEGFVRRVARLKKEGKITRCTLFCDIRAARKTLSIYDFIKTVFDEVRLCHNHSKVYHFSGADKLVAIVTSQNQTRGDRAECGVVFGDDTIAPQLLQDLLSLHPKSIPLHELISRPNKEAPRPGEGADSD